MKRPLTTVLAGLLLAAGGYVHALEIDPAVPPEINLGGRAIATTNYHRIDTVSAGKESETELDIADSSLLFGFSKYLFSDTDYGFAVVGLKVPEDGTELKDDIYLHELHLGVGGPRYEVKLGRSRLGNTLIQFPTLRDDDLLGFTHVPNGLSNAEAEEYQQFGGVVSGSWFVSKRVALDGGFTARTRIDAPGAGAKSSDFNGGYFGIAYELPEAVKVDRGLRYAGLRLDTQRTQDLGPGLAGDRLNAVIGGLVLNLNENPERTWNLDLQAIAVDGNPVPDLSDEVRRARARSRSVVTALRYGHRPNLQTRWQAALTLAWKEYPGFGDASAWVVAPSYVRRLGSGVDLLAQYQYVDYDSGLAAALDRNSEHKVFLGLQFAFDHTFNESVGERKSILNLEHNTLDIGPLGGGH